MYNDKTQARLRQSKMKQIEVNVQNSSRKISELSEWQFVDLSRTNSVRTAAQKRKPRIVLKILFWVYNLKTNQRNPSGIKL